MTEIINVDLEQLCGVICVRPERNIRDLDEVLNRVPWQQYGGVDQVLCQVSGGLSHRAKQTGTFDPTHFSAAGITSRIG